MTLVRYNPLSNFVPSTFGDLIENAIRENENYSFSPAVDIINNENSIDLLVSLPGIKKEDIVIDLDNDTLTIKGERKLNEEAEILKRETKYGKFERVFNLNEEIDSTKINAAYTDGILKVTLAKAEQKAKTTIKVK